MSSLYLNASEQQLLSALTTGGVRYAILGGHAVQHYGHLRTAKDLDILVLPTIDNAQRAGTALRSLMPPVVLSAEQINRLSKSNVQMRINGIYNTEVLTTATGIDTPMAIASAKVVFDGAVSTWVLSLTDLLTNKRELGRPVDLEDVEALTNASGVG